MGLDCEAETAKGQHSNLQIHQKKLICDFTQKWKCFLHLFILVLLEILFFFQIPFMFCASYNDILDDLSDTMCSILWFLSATCFCCLHHSAT